MSRIRANQITNQAADGAPTVQHGLIIAGVSTFTGSVSIGGTLTYEDVTNMDSIGIVTARGGIHIDDSIVHIGDTNTKIRFPTGDVISAETNGAERVRITSDGKIGIGVASPDGLLEVYNSSVSGNTVLKIHNDKTGDAANITIEGKRTSDNDTGQVLFRNNNYSVAGIFANAGGSGNHDNGYLKFLTSPVGSSNVLTERLRIKSDGEVNFANDAVFTNASWTGNKAGKIQQHSNILYIQGGSSGTKIRAHDGAGETIFTGKDINVEGGRGSNDDAMIVQVLDTYHRKIQFAEATDAYSIGDYGGFIGYDAANNYMTLGTNNAGTAVNAITIQRSGGYVTKPNQPSFHARRVNNTSSTANPLVYDSVHYNNGSHYKSSGTDQGKFVAPVSGVYLFYWTAIKTNNGSVCRLYINVNNSHIYSNMHLRLQEQGTYSNGSMQAILNLSSGDKVHISLESGSIHGNEYTHFGGYLIG